jgi:hypothetical protein
VTSPRTSTPWPAPDRRTAAPDAAGHISAGHISRAARPAPPAALAALDRILHEISYPVPTTRALALEAVQRLAGTRTALLAYTDPAAGIDREMRRAISVLLGRAGFVLTHWTAELAKVTADGFSAAHADELAADLAEIARTGAALCDLITTPSAAPPPAPGLSVAARHRRSAPHPPQQSAPGAVGGADRLPPGSRRHIVQAGAITAAAAVVGSVCYVSFDRGRSHSPTAAVMTSGTSSAGHGAATSVSSPPRTAARPAPPVTAASAPGQVTSLQIQLLGASADDPRVDGVVYIDTASTAALNLQISYHGTVSGHSAGESATVSGRTSYQFSFTIDASPYCGGGLVVAAVAGGESASQSTSTQPCPTASTGRE